MRNIFICLTVLSLFLSCTDDNRPLGMVSSRRIRPVVSAGALTKAGGEQNLDGLKASGFTLEIIADAAYNNGTSLAGKFGDTRTVTWESSWKIAPDAFWINDTKMSFWAYNMAVATDCDIIPITPNAGNMSFTYPKSTATPDGQTDLLLAYNNKTHNGSDSHASGSSGDEISLEFYHALSKICFASGITGMPAGYTLSSITVNGLKTGGTCQFTGGASPSFVWTDLNGSSAYSVADQTKSFIVVPQNAGTNGATIQLKLTHASNPPILLTAPLADYAMVAGKSYEYKLKISEGRKLSLSLTVKPWELDARTIEFKPQNVEATVSYNSGKSYIQDASQQIIIKNGLPVEGSFKVIEPKGAKLMLALDGNLDAFEVDPKMTIIDGNVLNFTITPLVHDPKIDYHTQLHVYLIKADGTAVPIDEDVLGSYKDYTIVLPRQ